MRIHESQEVAGAKPAESVLRFSSRINLICNGFVVQSVEHLALILKDSTQGKLNHNDRNRRQQMNSIKRIVGVLAITLMTTSVAEAKFHVNHGKASGGKKAPPNTMCKWGPAVMDAPSGWQELLCGSDPKPYALGNKDLSDISITRPVAYLDKADGSSSVVSIQTSTKGFEITIPMDRLPNGIKEDEWFVIDPNVVKFVKMQDKQGTLTTVVDSE